MRVELPMAAPLPRGWFWRIGWGCQMPFLGFGPERFGNGWIVRVSLWPMRFGFHVVAWHEPNRPREMVRWFSSHEIVSSPDA